MSIKTVTIIATGTEVTSGQVFNLNSSWIAQKLSENNYEVIKHIAVDDNNSRILEALRDAHLSSDMVIVTGGLGPTTDDLTRKLVSDWDQKELIFDEKEWDRIQTRLRSFDLEPRDGHRWQAFFPKGSTVFTNQAGTASGFLMKVTKDNKDTIFIFLPGPPYEIKQIWKDHLAKKLKEMSPVASSTLLTWQFIDLAESELAYVVDPLLAKYNFTIGYRASPPLVELKVWVATGMDKNIPEFNIIEQKLEKYLHYKNGQDPMIEFFKTYQNKYNTNVFYIQDEFTDGEILRRLEELKQRDYTFIDDIKIFYANTEFNQVEYPFLKIYKNENSLGFTFYKNKAVNIVEEVPFRRKISDLRQKKWANEVLFKKLISYS